MGSVVAALLNGKIPFEMGAASRATGVLGRVRVGCSAVAAIIAMRHDMMPKVTIERSRTWCGSDALECLNGNASASQLLEGIASTGAGRQKRLPVECVLERAAAGVTTFDLTRRSGISTTRIAHLLNEGGVTQIAPGLWERAPAEALVLAAPPPTRTRPVRERLAPGCPENRMTLG